MTAWSAAAVLRSAIDLRRLVGPRCHRWTRPTRWVAGVHRHSGFDIPKCSGSGDGGAQQGVPGPLFSARRLNICPARGQGDPRRGGWLQALPM